MRQAALLLAKGAAVQHTHDLKEVMALFWHQQCQHDCQ
jgi:hypothetical protein